jgi:hypothetical protein
LDHQTHLARLADIGLLLYELMDVEKRKWYFGIGNLPVGWVVFPHKNGARVVFFDRA